MSRRGLVVVSAGAVIAAAVAVQLLVRGDDATPVEGDLIAFGCRERGNPWYAVCVVHSDGSERRRLTQHAAVTDPAWSPDGRRLALTWHETGSEYQRFTEDDIYVMEGDGDSLRPVTTQRPGESSFDPTWSPEASHVAYLRSSEVASESPTRFGRLTTAEEDGSNVRPLGANGLVADPEWSPDGREIAIVVPTLRSDVPTVTNTDVYIVDVATGRRRALVASPDVFESSPAWSPDGSQVAFARWRPATQFDGKASIHVVGRDGSGARQVLAHQHYAAGAFNLSWSPDGTELAFETSPSALCVAISVVAVETGAVRPLTTCTRAFESTVSPSWQPDPRPAD
jgi:Tol biopolymer transport system component